MSELFTRIWPAGGEPARRSATELAEEWAAEPVPAGRPRLTLNMVATADGRVTVGGRAGPLSNPADREHFHALRAAADAVMVGAGTLRAERYGRMIKDAEVRDRRTARGERPDPLCVVVTRSLRLPADLGLLAEPGSEVVILTPEGEATLPDVPATVHYLREADLPVALGKLRAEHGVETLLCEGGPDLNASLLACGVVDELHLVTAALLASGPNPLTAVTGPPLQPPRALELRSVHESGNYLFTRYTIG